MVTTVEERGAGAAERYQRHREKYRKYKERILKKGKQNADLTEINEYYQDATNLASNAATNKEEFEEDQEEASRNPVATAPTTKQPPKLRTSYGRHIRPCLCDLTASARKRISDYQSQKSTMYNKFVKRTAEIEAELKRRRQEALDKERELADQHELFEDEYELSATGIKKRKKRSARRVSMVSLGVRTLIKWKKEPTIRVVLNRTWHLRRYGTHYCDAIHHLLPQIEVIDYKKEPLVPVRETNAFGLRLHFNKVYKNVLTAMEDKRQPFVLDVIM